MKVNLEKAKQTLEKETSELHVEIRSLAQGKQDGEHKRKKVEGQLVDLQSRFNDSEKQKAELGDRVSKITVSDGGGCIIRYVAVGSTCNMFVSLKVFDLRANRVCLTCGSLTGGTGERYQPP